MLGFESAFSVSGQVQGKPEIGEQAITVSLSDHVVHDIRLGSPRGKSRYRRAPNACLRAPTARWLAEVAGSCMLADAARRKTKRTGNGALF
jgi:hypothetical protein